MNPEEIKELRDKLLLLGIKEHELADINIQKITELYKEKLTNLDYNHAQQPKEFSRQKLKEAYQTFDSKEKIQKANKLLQQAALKEKGLDNTQNSLDPLNSKNSSGYTSPTPFNMRPTLSPFNKK